MPSQSKSPNGFNSTSLPSITPQPLNQVIQIYSAKDIIEANIVKGMLNANGIPASINGGYLTGAAGELPALGLVTINVDKRDKIAAIKIISEYEQA